MRMIQQGLFTLLLAGATLPTLAADPIGVPSTSGGSGGGGGWDLTGALPSPGQAAQQVGSAVLPTIAAQGGQYSGLISQIGSSILESLNSANPSAPVTVSPQTGPTSSAGITGPCTTAQRNNADDYTLERVTR